MDFANEYYVRLYTRDTTTWKRLLFNGQTVLMHVLRKLDMAGVLELEDMEPWEAAVLHCNIPEDIARDGMARCLSLGVLVHNGRYLVAPKYREANEANKSDRQRQSELRARRRAMAMDTAANVTKRDTDEHVTKRDSSVTDGHVCSSQPVTTPSRSATKHHTRSHAVTLTSSSSNSDTNSDAVASSDSGSVTTDPPPPIESRKVTPEIASREWHRIGQPVWNGEGVLNDPTSHHRESYEVITASCNATSEPIATLAALLEYFWLAPHGPIASGRISHPSPTLLAKRISRDLAEALAWKRGEVPKPRRNGKSHTDADTSDRADRKPIAPWPTVKPEPSEVPQ